jgi:hypothetical protein
MTAAHVCTPDTCPEPSRYFVTAVDGPAVHYMAGPYTRHADALQDVDKALRIADKHDGRAWFMGWGTVRITDPTHQPGRRGTLNKAGLL